MEERSGESSEPARTGEGHLGQQIHVSVTEREKSQRIPMFHSSLDMKRMGYQVGEKAEDIGK